MHGRGVSEGTTMSEENPCIGVCEIDDGYCIGCGRSADEIFGETDSAAAGSDAIAEQVQPLAGDRADSSD